MPGRRKKPGNISLLQLAFNPATLMLIVTVAIAGLWNQLHPQLFPAGQATLSGDALQVSAPPPWIRTPVREVAIRDSRLNEVTLQQPDSVERVAAALAVQPWIKTIESIHKTSTGIRARVAWRKPVGIVEFSNDQLVPVDDESVVLEGEGLVMNDPLEYWRISVPGPLTNGLTSGRVWDDLRIQDAVRIVNFCEARQVDLGLIRVVNRSYPTADRIRLNPYELWTPGGTIVFWGNPPGHEAADEATAAEKFQALAEFVEDNGPLDSCPWPMLDVRQGTVRQAEPGLADASADFIHQLK